MCMNFCHYRDVNRGQTLHRPLCQPDILFMGVYYDTVSETDRCAAIILNLSPFYFFIIVLLKTCAVEHCFAKREKIQLNVFLEQ